MQDGSTAVGRRSAGRNGLNFYVYAISSCAIPRDTAIEITTIEIAKELILNTAMRLSEQRPSYLHPFNR
jgi:hypothetical protein